MAIFDNMGQLSGSLIGSLVTGQTITGASAVISTNTIDMLVLNDTGQGNRAAVLVNVTTAFAGLTALEMQVIAADDSALTSNVTMIGSSGPIPVASLTTSARFRISINPRIASKGQRYLGMRYVPTGTGTAGALVASLTEGTVQDGQKIYPGGFQVL